jgi:uncharacterized protein (TIGR02217 family)
MPFDNARFPTAISRGASGGPERRTDAVLTASGREHRNSRWADSRRKYNIGFGIKSIDDIHAVLAFFEERRGRLHAFRFKDYTDFKSCSPTAAPTALDQPLGTGTGIQSTFQLAKSYGSGLRNYTRQIAAPVAGTILVAVNGIATTAFTANLSTGLITFNTGNTPANGATITAGFEFDVPVRFDTDELSINLDHFNAGDIPSIPLIEVKP